YGRTTGRARRCGWFDAVVARRGVMVNGATSVALTKIDVLCGVETIKICTAYNYRGQQIDQLPTNPTALRECEPVYEKMAGWTEPLDKCTSIDEFPPNARAYIARIEELIGCKISILSVGPARSQTIVLNDPFVV
ncbi:MAG: adenylosuccinate synthetase, partial [Candidatus Hydrogenedentes bacterium]|nr:adenylosuccinate synthetase [Candidatus Hydrogenedentota bacterium]